jgi:hypothetical protein
LEFDIGFLLEVSLIPGETRGIGRRFTCGCSRHWERRVSLGRNIDLWAAVRHHGIWYARNGLVKMGQAFDGLKPEQLDSLAFGMPKTFQKLR